VREKKEEGFRSDRLPEAPLHFTICSNNYLHYAMTLGESLLKADPAAQFAIFLADEPNEYTAEAAQRFTIIAGSELAIPNYRDMAFKYNVLEFNTAIKPFCFDYAFDVMGRHSAIYLDPDTLVLSRLFEVEESLRNGASCVLTPHSTEPITDGKNPDDYSFLACGSFNLGFVALSASAEAQRFLRWWGDKLAVDCFVALERGIFVDQKYADLAPSLMDEVTVLRHPGYNLAYWNLAQRAVAERDGAFTANDLPLRFVHFSGISLSDKNAFSRHQERFAYKDLPKAFKKIYDAYFLRLKTANGAGDGRLFADADYAYGRFSNGVSIPPVLRRVYARYRSLVADDVDVFQLDVDFFLARSDLVPLIEGLKISRLAYEGWITRPDLQRAFDLQTEEGQRRYLGWAAHAFGQDFQIPGNFISAATTAVAAPEGEALTADDFLLRALTSRTLMMRNYLRRQFKGKARAEDYWRRRLVSGRPRLLPQTMSNMFSHDGRDQEREALSIHGLFTLETGTGQLARGFARAMLTTGHPASCHNIPLPTGWYEQKEAFPSSGSHHSSSKAALICLNADCTTELDRFIPGKALANKKKIAHWVWELPDLPDAWLGGLDNVDEVWTPTRYVADAVRKKTEKPVLVVPYVIERTEQSPSRARAMFGLPQDRLLILMAFDYNSFASRKNPIAGLRAFIDAFPKPRPSTPLLVVKCHGPAPSDGEMKRLIASRPDVILIDEVLRESEMCTLQNACDIFLSMHRAEGFGMNIAECMVLGKLAIATGYSGNDDFMSTQNSIPLPFNLIPVEPGQYVHGDGQHWANPRHDDAVDALRWAAGNYGRSSKLRQRARQDIVASFSADAVGRQIIAALER
jgi:glycosyltransferase involved in cell wall biosynthesis